MFVDMPRRSTGSSVMHEEIENTVGSYTVVSTQYSKSSSSNVHDYQITSKNEIENHEAVSGKLESQGYEHEQNVYNTVLLKRSPQMANGQVKQFEEYSDAMHDQSWFRVHSDVFKDKFYWNRYEKTDLTYSKLSPYYNKEISPGVPVMPNLSRRPLRSRSAAAAFTPQRSAYYSSADLSGSNSSMNIRNSYVEQRTTGHGFDGYSDDEGDFIKRRQTIVRKQRSVSVVTTIFTFISTVLTSIYTSCSQAISMLLNRRSVLYGDVYRGYSTPQARHEKHTRSVKWGHWLYRLLCHQILADSWLLHYLSSWTQASTTVTTTTHGAERQASCSRFMFCLFFLLPLAFLAGWWAIGAYPILSSKPAEILRTFVWLGNERSHKEEIRLPVISSSDNTAKDFLDMKSYTASLAVQVEALKERVMEQHKEMEAQQAQLQLMEKILGRLDVNLELSKAKDSDIESTLHHVQLSLHSVTGKVQRLGRCCDRPPIIPAGVIQGHVLQFLRKVFSTEGQDNYDDIHAWVKSLFVAKDELETRLANVSAAVQSNVSEELVQSAKIIMESVAERIIQSKLDEHRYEIQATSASARGVSDGAGLTHTQVKQIVQEVLSVYDADKTGLVDYALESSGGFVLSTRCTENFDTNSATLFIFNFRWLPWITVGTSPRMAIQPHMNPGECWAFAGVQGFLVIQLSHEIYVSGFTLEHIPKSLSPGGHIDSAPEKFSVWGLEKENDEDPLLLGNYVYMQNSSSLQYFKVQQEVARPFRIVELRVMSNHGNPNYTCIYRFRVHGTPVQK